MEGMELPAGVHIGDGAVDLDKLRRAIPPPELVAELAEGQLGLRCNGCQRRIKSGFRFTQVSVEPGAAGEMPKVDVQRRAACAYEDCDFAARARDGATVVERVEFVWLDGRGDPADERPVSAAAEPEADAPAE